MNAFKFCSIALASGLVIGLLAGRHLGRTMGAGQAILWEMSAAAGYEELALLQYGQADTDHSRQALLGFTNFSKSVNKLQSASRDRALLEDTAWAYLRLAAIEELAGNSTLSHQYVLAAQQSFKSMGREITEEELNKQVTKIASTAPPKSPPSAVPPPVHVQRASAP
jgi:hypothetical protein